MRRTLSGIRTFLTAFLSALNYNLVRIRALGMVKKKQQLGKRYGRSSLEKVYLRINCRQLKILFFFSAGGYSEPMQMLSDIIAQIDALIR